VSEHGQLAAEAKAQETRITERAGLVRDLASQHRIGGYEVTPLEEQKVADFTTQLATLQRQRNAETERLQVRVARSFAAPFRAHSVREEREQGEGRRVQR
jgi:DNA repair protein RAD50